LTQGAAFLNGQRQEEVSLACRKGSATNYQPRYTASMAGEAWSLCRPRTATLTGVVSTF